MAGRAAVRLIRADDAEAVEAASALVVDAYRDLLGEELGEDYARILADVADRASRATVLAAVEGGRMLGCITYVDGQGPYAEFDDEDAAGIRMLAVAPAAQGRGIGALLVRSCIARARSAGWTRIVLHSTAPMRAAQRLYLREGFVRRPERDIRIRPDLLLLGYELRLRPGDAGRREGKEKGQGVAGERLEGT